MNYDVVSGVYKTGRQFVVPIIFLVIVVSIGVFFIVGYLLNNTANSTTLLNDSSKNRWNECYAAADKKEIEAKNKLCSLNKKNDGSCIMPGKEFNKIISDFNHAQNICYRNMVNDLKITNECQIKYPNDEREESICYINQMFVTPN